MVMYVAFDAQKPGFVLHLAFDLVSSSILLGVYWLLYSVFAAQQERLLRAQAVITRIYIGYGKLYPRRLV